ncbi:MAG: hypothetical protein ACKOX2_03280, partial [Microcystaceae cyanobacterium]
DFSPKVGGRGAKNASFTDRRGLRASFVISIANPRLWPTPRHDSRLVILSCKGIATAKGDRGGTQ